MTSPTTYLEEEGGPAVDDIAVSKTTPHGSTPLEKLHPAIVNLRDYQGQLDEDGICVAVSRQAVEETLAITLELLDRLRALVEANDSAALAMAECTSQHEADKIAKIRGASFSDLFDPARATIVKATNPAENGDGVSHLSDNAGSSTELGGIPGPRPATGPALEIVDVVDEEGGAAVAVCITFPDGSQVWSGEVSQSLFDAQATIDRDALGGGGGDFVVCSEPSGTRILARAVDQWVAMDVALAYAEWRHRSSAELNVGEGPRDTSKSESSDRIAKLEEALRLIAAKAYRAQADAFNPFPSLGTIENLAKTALVSNMEKGGV